MKEKSSSPTKKVAHKPIKKVLLSIGSIVLLGVIAVAFVFSPSLMPGQDGTLPPFGSYNGKKIEYIQNSLFANLVENYSNQMEANGQPVDTSTLYTVMNQAFRDTAMRLGYEDEVTQSGYIAPDSLIERKMLPYFSDENGVYSPRVFRDTADGTKIEIKNAVESQINYDLYSEDVAGIKTATNEMAFIEDMDKNQRSFNMVSFNTADYPKEAAADFGHENAELFTQYNMNVITLNTENEANKIAEQIKNSELTFADAVSVYSIDQYGDEEGKLKNKLHHQLKTIIKSEDVFNALIELESGTTSDVIETSTGFSIFTATSLPQNPDFTNATTVDVVYNYMTIYEAGIIEDYYADIAKDFVTVALIDGFDTAVADFDVEKIEVPAFPINYGNNQLLGIVPSSIVTQLANAQTNEQFLKTAFSLTEGKLSKPIVMGTQVVVLTLNEEIADDTEEDDTLSLMYPYYVSQFDNVAIQSHFMRSDKLENDVTNVFFSHFLQ